MDYFANYPIQDKVKESFIKSIRSHHLAHAYLFHGSEGCGKEAFALELAKAINCEHHSKRPCYICASCQKIALLNHPDIKLIFPTAKSWSDKDIKSCIIAKAQNIYAKIDLGGYTVIQIERIRELKNEAKYAPYEAKKKVYIISEAEKMTREGANAFLKLLEEPPDSLLIILITFSVKSLLDTIRSRCQPVHFSNLNDDQVRNIVSKYLPLDDQLESVIHVAEGNLKSIFAMVKENFNEKRDLVLKYLRAIAGGNIMGLTESVDTMTRQKDKNYLKDVLNLLILWFKDSIHIKNIGSDSRIINVYFTDELKKFMGKYGASNLDQMVNEIENAITNINRNIYAPLVLTTLAIRIKRHLIKN